MERQAKDGTVYKMVGTDEWEPVTRTAKDGTTYKKIGNDEWTVLDSTPAPKAEPEDNRSFLEKFQAASDVRNMPKNMMAGLQKIDEYTGAPIRKLVTETLTGKEMEKAPTGSEQAKMMGATDKTYGEAYGVPAALGGNISPADIYGVGLEAIQDPILLAGKAAQGVKGLFKGGQAVADTFRAKQALKATQTQAAQATAQVGAKSKAMISGGGLDIEQSGKLFDYKAPQSLKELEEWKPQAGTGEMLGKTRLKEIVSIAPDIQTKPLNYHYDMLENPKAMKELKLKFENLPTDSAKRIATYNQEMVNESERKIKQITSDLAGGVDPKNLPDAGNDFIATVKEKYNAEKEALGPLFQELNNNARKSSRAETMDMARAIGENTKLGKLMEVDEQTGKLYLAKNTPRTGLSNSEHSILSQVIDDMNDGMTFKEIQDTRSFLKKSVDPMNPGASAEIEKVRSLLLGQLEDMANGYGPNVSETFKAYAINERARESVEKVIGGRIETLDSMYAANPDRVVQKIFSNPNYAKVVGEYVGPEKMNEMVASYIQSGISKSVDSVKGFQPSTLKSWLKTNSNFLKANADPALTQRLNALADYGYLGKRFLDEVNPSGTAASLQAMIEPKGFLLKVKNQGISGALQSEVAGRVDAMTKQRQSVRQVNEMLGTKEPSMMQNAKANVQKKLSNASNVSDSIDEAKKFQMGAATARGTIRDVTPKSSADQNDAPEKGPTKWANDGIKKLQEHDSTFNDPAIVDQLMKSKKGKDLLIKASDLKPGSKAMQGVILEMKDQLKNRSAGKNEAE